MEPQRECVVRVEKERFKFNCAHFIAYPGFRERLHGHNYRVGVALAGPVGPDGYVVDFGVVKDHTMRLCKGWNERFICPTESPVLKLERRDGSLFICCEDGAKFVLPEGDCLFLPIRYSSAEELAAVFAHRLVESMTREMLERRGISRVEVSISEAAGQTAAVTVFLGARGTDCAGSGAGPRAASTAEIPPSPCRVSESKH